MALLLAAAPLRAYVTSATLELMADDKAGVYLNGKMLLDDKHCEMLYNWFMCLSTSDNTLPLDLFKNNQDNLLGIINYDVYGGEAEISYRLTVHQSQGDPIVIWSQPGQTRFMNLHSNQPDPPAWYLPNFDDSKWAFANAVVGIGGNFIRLPDDRLKASFGAQGFVPLVAPNSTGHTIPQDRNIYRNHFVFPNSIAKADLLTNPKTASRGQQVAVRIVPGRDAGDISDFSVFADLPVGLEPTQIRNGGAYNPSTRQIQWQYRDIGKLVEYVSISAQTVLESGGWKTPERALGPFKPELMAWHDGGSTPAEQKLLGAFFWPGMPAWFKTSPTPYVDGLDSPIVLGIIFRIQYMAGGSDTPYKKEVNDIYMNYSIDGTDKDALKDDKRMSFCANSGMWQTGYYDASEDGHWTWDELNKLRIKLVSRQYNNRQQDQVVSCFATIRCIRLQNCAPTFFARVDDPRCEKLRIQAGVAQADGKAVASDPFYLDVNTALCVLPTPIPRPTPVPVAPGVTPMPTATSVPLKLADVDALGCLHSSPEPFKLGGVFLYFCSKLDANVDVTVRDGSGKVVRSIAAVSSRSGDNQVFFDAMDDSGRALAPGAYNFELSGIAADGRKLVSHRADFNRAREER